MNIASPPAATAAALRSYPRLRYRDLDRIIGPISYDTLILESLEATRLCGLPRCGVLLLSRGGEIAAVHATEDEDVALAQIFPGTAEVVWSAVAAVYPGVVPGRTFPRFWIGREQAGAAWSPLYGVVDIAALDVVVRSPDYEEA